MQASYAIVDWGTSNFRIWMLDRDGAVLAERRSHEGMIHTSPDSFSTVLESHLASLGADTDLPVMVCGMAGSRQGWHEAPYLDLPASLSGLPERAARVPGISRPVHILPGIAQRNSRSPDVMRGEETQLLGAAMHRPEIFSAGIAACMPGTHSKWVRLERGIVTGFSTFMTGEFYNFAANHSILAAMIAANADFDAADAGFAAAVRDSFADPAMIANRLFSARPARLLGFCEDDAAAPATSGALIGLELAGARRFHELADKVMLIASGRLAQLYQAAFEAIGLAHEMVDADLAVRLGLYSACSSIWPQTSSRHTGSSRP
ncbi:MAG: 2-dehydro-3-deoxygalactonokinase [Nitratireductor sp.]